MGPETIQRTSVATAPSEAGWVYALAADRYGGVLGVYQSWDKGTTWREIGHGHFAGEKYLNNANSIAVDPSDPYRVICGGVDLHLWEGGRWSQATFWRSKSEDWEYAHADHRGLLWPQTKRLYDLNDGGVALSTDGGWSWEDRTEGLVNTMFYDLDVAPGDPQGQAMGGGTQDQGTLVTVDGPAWFEDVTGGDGGWMAFDHKEKKRFYATVYEGAVYFHDSFDNSWSEDASPPEEDWIKASLFLSPLRIHPDRERPETVYYGTTRIWQSKPAPRQRTSWHRLSEDLDGSPVTALEVASNSAYLYAGTQNGGVFASQDHGASWSGDLSSRVLPGALITRIRAHPKKPLHVLLCVGLFGHPHVFRSIDGGETWKPVSQSLPDIPFRALVIDPENPDVVYAGSDAGIFVSRDFGNSWKTFIGDLPGVMVTDLVIHSDGATPPVRHLYASTFGRGIWRTPIP
ncbi:MAG: hypothetical protein GY719_41480 [bacterium]|nr:hypothetical protein [bacterium]